MKNIDIYLLLVGAGCFVMGIAGLFRRRISWLRRVIFLLIFVFCSAVGFASAFHIDFSTMTGISWPVIIIMLFFLIPIYFIWDIWDDKRKHDPDA